MKPYVIGIAGPSGSGKTTLANHLAAALGGATIFSLDHYYLPLTGYTLEQRAGFNFDHPEALESRLLIEHVTALAEGRSIARPNYDFATHARLPETDAITCGPFLIVEGLFTLHWETLHALYHTSVYMELDDQTCYNRRMKRDICERGRTPESVKLQYETQVRPMAEQFIYPTRAFAGLVVPGDEPIDDTVTTVMADIGRKCAKAAPAGTSAGGSRPASQHL